MDYGLVAPGPAIGEDGQPSHEARLKAFLKVLKVNQPNVASIGGLVSFVNGDSSVTRPIGDLFVGAHSNAQGQPTIQMAVKQAPEKDGKFLSDYETVEDTMDGTIGSIAIADATIGPDPTKHLFHFKGCAIGKAEAFLQKWKQALGTKVQISAPRYNHGLAGDTADRGIWEFMTYEFVLYNPEPFSNRDILVQAFQAEKFQFLETIGPGLVPGPAIPDENWNRWIPTPVDTEVVVDPKTKKPKIDRDTNKPITRIIKQKKPQWRQFGVQAVALPVATVSVNEQFSADESPFVRPITYPSPEAIPTTHAAQMVDLETNLRNDAIMKRLKHPRISRFTDAHPYPVYKRWGYDDLGLFLNGFIWSFTPKPKLNLLVARGSRQRYTLFIGLTDPNPGPVTINSQLRTNFYPFTNSFLPGNQLPLNDERFFKII